MTPFLIVLNALCVIASAAVWVLTGSILAIIAAMFNTVVIGWLVYTERNK
jgi:hypothetical protein